MVGVKMKEHKQEFEQVHKENYIQAVKELIHNNTQALIEDDLKPLFDKPPLDSMDIIRSKLLVLAKEQKMVLEVTTLNDMILKYQQAMQKSLAHIGKIREDALLALLKSFTKNQQDSIKILKKDLIQIDKQIQKEVKQTLEKNVDTLILQNLSKLFCKEKENLTATSKQMKDFIKKKYCKQILESLDIKILVKDTTLLNVLKEQTNRYLFTLENSHLFD